MRLEPLNADSADELARWFEDADVRARLGGARLGAPYVAGVPAVVEIADHRFLRALRPPVPLADQAAPGWLEATAAEPHLSRQEASARRVQRETEGLETWLREADRRQRRDRYHEELAASIAAQRLWGTSACSVPYIYRGDGDDLTISAAAFAGAVKRLFKVAPWWERYGPARRDLQTLVAIAAPVVVEAENAWVRRQGDAEQVADGSGSWVCVAPDRLDVVLKLERPSEPLGYQLVPLSVSWGDVTDGARACQYADSYEALSTTCEPQSEFGDLNIFGHYMPFSMTCALRDGHVANPLVCAYTGAMSAPEGSQPIEQIRAVMDAAMVRLEA
jgi:hypothetical protein